jgi:glycosyltransferase involved in cell wall biosynthesis
MKQKNASANARNPDRSIIDLSVLVPTYNRTHLLPGLLSVLESLQREYSEIRWEVVVSDNCSSRPLHQASLEALCPCLRIIQPNHHLPTAEENLFFALPQVRGNYVWLLGDDDEVNLAGVRDLVQRVMAGTDDFLIYNSGVAAPDGRLLSAMRSRCIAAELRIPLLEFIQRTGMTYGMAAFSTTIFRRECLQLDFVTRLVQASKIYSHVALWIQCFHDKKFVFVNKSLVTYRQNDWDIRHREHSHWEEFALGEGVFLKFPWTLGIVRLCKFLEGSGVINRLFLGSIIDQIFDRRVRLVHLMASWLLEQLVTEPFRDPALAVSDEEFIEILSYLRSTAPDQHEVWHLIEQARQRLRRAKLRDLRFECLKAGLIVRGVLDQRLAAVPVTDFFAGMCDGQFRFETPWGERDIHPAQLEPFLQNFAFIDWSLPPSFGTEISAPVFSGVCGMLAPDVAALVMPERGRWSRWLRMPIHRAQSAARELYFMYRYRKASRISKI